MKANAKPVKDAEYTIPQRTIELVLLELRDAAESALDTQTQYVVGDICTAVAHLIAGAGTYGGTSQRNLMDLASRIGFQPEYYVSSIRVTFIPKKKRD